MVKIITFKPLESDFVPGNAYIAESNVPAKNIASEPGNLVPVPS